MKLSTEILIDKPVSEVWDFLSDLTNLTKWGEGVEQVSTVTEGPLRVGSRVKVQLGHTRGRQTATFEVVELEPQSLLSVKAVTGWTAFQSWTRLTERPAGTRLAYTFVTGGADDPKTLDYQVPPADVSRVTETIALQDFLRLKTLLEA